MLDDSYETLLASAISSAGGNDKDRVAWRSSCHLFCTPGDQITASQSEGWHGRDARRVRHNPFRIEPSVTWATVRASVRFRGSEPPNHVNANRQVASAGDKSRQANLIKLADKTVTYGPLVSAQRRSGRSNAWCGFAVCHRGWNGSSMILQRMRKSLFITNDLDCDPSIRRHRTRALAQR